MTRDEMVQRLYINYTSMINSKSGYPCLPNVALENAEQDADYFFTAYKPKKKKREVLVVERDKLALDAYKHKTYSEVFGHTNFFDEVKVTEVRREQFNAVVEILNAIRSGKSVRMK